MTVRRGLLYLGAFLVAAGGVTLLGAAGQLDTARVAELLAWWPVALIAIGVALVLRRTAVAIPAGIAAAVAPGLLLGGVAVSVPNLSTFCDEGAAATGTPVVQDGSFESANARVSLDLSCGELAVTTAPGTTWSVDARNGQGRTADIVSGPEDLRLTSRVERGAVRWNPGADAWQVTLPTATTLDVDSTVNAGRGRLDLADARLGTVGIEVNAGETTADLRSATLGRLDVAVNAGAATVHLPATGGFAGDIEVNAGSVELCVPDGLAVRLSSEANLGSIDLHGLVRSGDAWVTPGTTTAQSTARLTVEASVGSVDINAEGVCK